MKICFSLVLLFGVIATSKGIISEEEIVIALIESNTDILNEALNSVAADVVASAFSSAIQNGNFGTIKYLAKVIYQVMSTNPTESFLSKRTLDVLEQIKKQQGCDLILQIFKEIDGLITSEEISDKLQDQVSGSQVILDCLPTTSARFVDMHSSGFTAYALVPFDARKCMPNCDFWDRSQKYWCNTEKQLCDIQRVCNSLPDFNNPGSCKWHCGSLSC